MENSALPDADDGRDPPGGPTLPPRPTAPVSDVWEDVLSEAASHAPHGRVSSADRLAWLLPTRAAGWLTTLGWAGAVIAQLMLLSALVPSFDLGETRNFVVPLDESAWFGATTIVSGLAIYLGWFWWSVSAAFNVRRVSPLSTSPWLPTSVYLSGPVLLLIGLDSTGGTRTGLVFAGCATYGLGHIAVVASFRRAAVRIGASGDEFAKLLWLPLAGVVYRVFVSLVLELAPQWRTTNVLIAFAAVGALFVSGMMVSTWRATQSFERACQRLNTRNLGADMPSPELISAAIRRSANR